MKVRVYLDVSLTVTVPDGKDRCDYTPLEDAQDKILERVKRILKKAPGLKHCVVTATGADEI